MSSGTSQQFCVRWNSHLGSLGAAFPQLLAGQRFVDVTLACEGHQLHCHRLVLAACSTYFESLLGENPCKHPIIILPRDIRLWEIQALVDFMYKGEVNVSQAGLSDLLKCAEILQIRGLCGSDAALNLNQVNSAATSSQATTSPTAISSLSSTVPSNAVTPVLSSSVASISQQPSDSPHSLTTSQTSTPLNVDCDRLLQNASSPVNSSAVTKNANDTTSKSSSSGTSTKRQATGRNENSSLLLKTSKNEKSSGSDQQQNETRYRTPTPNRLVGKVEPVDISLDEDMEDQDLSQSNEKISEGSDSYAAKYVDYLEGAKNENQHHLTQTQQQQQLEQDDNLRSSLPLQQPTVSATLSLSSPPVSAPLSSASTSVSKRHSNPFAVHPADPSKSNQCSSSEADNDENRNCIYDEVADIYIINDVDEGSQQEICIVEKDQDHIPERSPRYRRQSQCSNPSTTSPGPVRRLIDCRNPKSRKPEGGIGMSSISAPHRNNYRGKIRVKSNENLFDNFEINKPGAHIKEHLGFRDQPVSHQNHYDGYERLNSTTLHPATRGNRASLPGALRFNRNSMTVFLKPTKDHQAGQQVLQYNEDYSQCEEVGSEKIYDHTTIKSEYDSIEDSNYESIVCLPNVMEMYNDGEDGDIMTSRDLAEIDVDGNHLAIRSKYHSSGQTVINTGYEDIKVDEEMIYAQQVNSPNGLLHYHVSGEGNLSDHEGSSHHHHHHFKGLEICPANGRPMEFAMAQFLSDHIDGGDSGGDGSGGGDGSHGVVLNQRSSLPPSNSNGRRCRYVTSSSKRNPVALEQISNDGQPSLSAVVLRNPRSNQPRTYSNDALYAALMDVKAGESIYRASLIHKVPRKTLRNWMKRWHIKSAYPMPRQLKQAAEKKKRIQQQIEKMEKTIACNNTTMNSSGNSNNRSNNSQTSGMMLQSSSHRQQSHSISKLAIIKK